MTAPFITAVLDRFEGDKAVIRFDDGQTLFFPKTELFNQYKEGDALYFLLAPDVDLTVSREKLAAALINDLLNKDKI
jgi:hypothetical protein